MAQQLYTLEEAKAKYAAAGKEWTPEVEAYAMSKGYIKGATQKQPEVSAQHRGMLALEEMWRNQPGQAPSRDVRRVYGDQTAPQGPGANPDDPGVNLVRGIATEGTLGFYDPLRGEDWGYGTGNQIMASTGRGIGIAAPFALSAPVAAAARGAAAARMGVAGARALGTAAQFGAMGAARGVGDAINAPEGAGSGPGGRDLEAVIMQALKSGGKEAAIGAALGGLHMIPGMDRIARGAVSGPLMDTAIIGGMGAGQSVLAGEPVDWKQLAIDTPAFVAGMRAGNAVAARLPRKWSMSGGEREEADAVVRAKQMYEERLAQEASNRLPVPVGKPYSGSAPDYAGAVGNAQAWRQALPDPSVIAARAMNPVTTRRALPPARGEGTVLPAGTQPPVLPQTPYEAAEMAAGTMARAVERPINASRAARDAYHAEQARIESMGPATPKEQFGAPERPVAWEPPVSEAPTPAGTLVDAMGLPAPSTAQSAPRARPQAKILDASGRPLTRWSNLNSVGGQDVYEWAAGRIKEKSAVKGAARSARVDALARKMAEDMMAGKDVPGLDPNSLGVTFNDPNQKPDGAGGWDAAAGRWVFSNLDGVRASAPLVGYLNTHGSKGNWLQGAKRLIETINNDPSLLLVDDAVLGQAAKDEIGSVSKLEAPLTDRGRLWRRGTGGRYGNPMVRSGEQLGKLTERAREKMDNEFGQSFLETLREGGIKPNSYEGKQGLAKLMMLARDAHLPVREVAATPDGQAILSKAANPEALISTAERLKSEFEVHADLRNSLDRAMDRADVMAGRKTEAQIKEKSREMDLIDEYLPRQERRYSMRGLDPNEGKFTWQELGRALEQWSRPVQRGIAETRNPRAWSAREQKSGRNLLDESRVNTDIYDLLTSYSVDTSRMLSNSLAINAGLNVAEAIDGRAKEIRKTDPLKAEKLAYTADAIRKVTQMAYNGQTRTWLEEVMGSTRLTNAGLLKPAQLMKIGFNAARYGSNIAFMTLTQPTSIMMAGAMGRLTPDMIGKALREYSTSRIKHEWENSYTGWVKSKKGGQILNEGSDMIGDRMLHPLEAERASRGRRVRAKITDQIEAPVRFVENSVTGRMVYALAEQIGMRDGLSGQRLRDFASDMVGQSQSYYDRMNRAQLLSDTFLNLAFPAQGFAMDVANTMRDASMGIRGTRNDLKAGERVAAIGKTMLMMYVMNLLYSAASTTDEDRAAGALKEAIPQSLGGMIPYMGQATGMTSQRSQGAAGIYPQQVLGKGGDIQKALEFASNDEWDRAFSTLANDFLPGGTQLRRVMEAERMIGEGRIKDDERIGGWMYGWARTDSGRKYIREIKESEERRKGTSNRSRRRGGGRTQPR